MTSPATVAVRTELNSALDTLAPQIKGLDDLLLIHLTDSTQTAVQGEQADHTRRRDLCQAVLAALDALEADSYPDMPKHELVASSYQELQEQFASITAALAEFEAEPVASHMSIGLGEKSNKTFQE